MRIRHSLLRLNRSGVILLPLLAALFLGCPAKNRGQIRGRVRQFGLTIALTAPLGPADTSGTPLPDDVKALMMPLQPGNCAEYLLLPRVRVIRLDVAGSPVADLILPLAQNALQVASGQAPDVAKERAKREDVVDHLTTIELMTKTGDQALVPQNLAKLLGSSNGDKIFVQAGAGEYLADQERTNRTMSPGNVADLLKEIGGTLCSKPGARPPQQLTALTVVHSNRATGVGASGDGPGGQETHGVTPAQDRAESTPLAREIDARNAQISVEESTTSRRKLANQTRAAYEQKVAGDPFALYSLSKTIIYGGEHHEAFEMLSEAAGLAIKQGRAHELLQRITEDIDKDLARNRQDRTIWRLTTPDHRHHWMPIVEALRANDSGLLQHHD